MRTAAAWRLWLGFPPSHAGDGCLGERLVAIRDDRNGRNGGCAFGAKLPTPLGLAYCAGFQRPLGNNRAAPRNPNPTIAPEVVPRCKIRSTAPRLHRLLRHAIYHARHFVLLGRGHRCRACPGLEPPRSVIARAGHNHPMALSPAFFTTDRKGTPIEVRCRFAR